MQELRKLKHSFDHWKETFKKRMRDTYAFVQKARMHHARRSGGSHVRHSGSRGGGGHMPGAGVPAATPNSVFMDQPSPQMPATSARIPPGQRQDHAHAHANAAPPPQHGAIDAELGSPRSSDSDPGGVPGYGKPYVQNVRDGMMDARRRGGEVVKGVVGKLQRSMSREYSAEGGRVAVTPQGTIERSRQSNGRQ